MCASTGHPDTTSTTAPMSSLLDDIDRKCNELMEEAVRAKYLNVDLEHDLSIKVLVVNEQGSRRTISTFPIETPGTTPKVHRRVFSTLATIVGENGLPNVTNVSIQMPRTFDEHNQTGTNEMTPFLQSIADSSTIQRLQFSTNFPFVDDSSDGSADDSSDGSVDTAQSDNISQPTNMVPLVTALAANFTSPQSVLNKAYVFGMHFDDEMMTILCEAISSRESRLVSLELERFQFPTLGPFWAALAANKSIQNVSVRYGAFVGTNVGDGLGIQQLQSMLETNTTMTELEMASGRPFPNSFFNSLGAGLASNATLTTLDLFDGRAQEQDYLTAFFEGGLDRIIGLEKLTLKLKDLSSTQQLVSGLERMANNVSVQRSTDGSHGVSPLKNLRLDFNFEESIMECAKLVFDSLVRNSKWFAWEQLHFDCWSNNPDMEDVEFWNKLAAVIQACPGLTTFHMNVNKCPSDADLEGIANSLENNMTITWLEADGLRPTADVQEENTWSLVDNPNRTRNACSIVRNIRGLPVFLNPSKTSLLPSVLATLLKPRKSKVGQVVNWTHAFHLVQNLPDLFSTDGSGGGRGGGKTVLVCEQEE